MGALEQTHNANNANDNYKNNMVTRRAKQQHDYQTVMMPGVNAGLHTGRILRNVLRILQENEFSTLTKALYLLDEWECGQAGDTGLRGDLETPNRKLAKDDAWPWQAAIYVDATFKCGGALVADNWVLTAANCFDKNMFKDLKGHNIEVILGQWILRFFSSNYLVKYNLLCSKIFGRLTTQYSEWTVGPLSSATCSLCLCSLLAATSQFSVFIGQKMQLTGWENANNMRKAICADTQTSNEWPYCSFLYCAYNFLY